MQMEYFRNILTEKQCNDIIDLRNVYTSAEVNTFAGVERPRAEHNHQGMTFYRFDKTEVQEHVDIFEKRFAGQVTLFRVIQYPVGSAMEKHLDGWQQKDGESNHGVVIQLNPQESYKGGQFILTKTNLIELNPGDGMLFHYKYQHQVKKIREGERWVLNIRVKMEGE